MADELFSVANQVVLVSGASRGIGRAIAEGFAAREAIVVITGRVADTIGQTAREICPPDGTVRSMVCDVADVDAVGSTVEEIAGEFGRIDTLVNCAGVNKRMKVEEYSEEEYDFITHINVRGAFFMAQAVGRQMIQAGRGSQIHIDSRNSFRPLRQVAPYAMSKAAMSSMTRAMAMEWGPHGVRVNAVAPGFTATELARPLWENRQDMNAWREENTPLRRSARPDEMGGATIFLASEASSFITGQILYVDGGTSCGLFWPIDG